MPQCDAIVIPTYADLLDRESDLLERVNALRNGGQLYLIHPLMLLAEIGVELAPAAQEEFAELHGGSGGWSAEPYRAMRESTAEQPSRVTMRGLFRRAS